MGIGHAQEFEHALHRAVLAAAAVQRVEHHLGAGIERLDHRAQIARHVDFAHVIAQILERLGAFAPAHQRDLAFGGPAAHQHGDVPAHGAASGAGGAPMRLISHSRLTPLFSRTRRRTSSPRFSTSAALASPVLMRKFACLDETCAPPTFKPRQPALSISSQALCPGGLAKGEPPVRARIGWLSSRCAWIAAMRAPMAWAPSRLPLKRAETNTQSSATPQWR